MKERLRPWLSVVGNSEPTYVFTKQGVITYRQFVSLSVEDKRRLDIEHFQWDMRIKNHGSLPAYEVRYGMQWSYEPFTRDGFKEMQLHLQSMYPLMPDQTGTISPQMPLEHWNKLQEERKDLFALLYVEYYFGEKRKGIIVYIFRFVSGRVDVIDSWIE